MTKPIKSSEVSGYRTAARIKLDEIRKLMGVPTPPRSRTCYTCGAEFSPIAACPICGGKQVRAENLLRAIRSVAKLEG
jgi:hypothetical protein